MEKSGRSLVVTVMKPKQRFDDFAVQELKSLLSVVGIDPMEALRPEINRLPEPRPKTYREFTSKCLERQYFAVLEIADDQLHLLQSVIDRSIMISTFFLLIGQGKTTEDMITKLAMEKFEKEVASTETFSFYVTATLRSIK